MSEESQFSEELNFGWIQWFCGLEDHSFFCEVSEDFIKNEFNLYGLKNKVSKYNEAYRMILRNIPPAEEEIEDPRFLQIYKYASELYGVIHARYITTPEGLAIMRERYLAGKYGNCPRVMCQKQNVLPIGISEDLKIARVKIYCPRCKDIYSPKKKSADVDGAYFGTSFPFLLLMTYTDLKPYFKREEFVLKLFGFKIQNNDDSEPKISQQPKIQHNNNDSELKQSDIKVEAGHAEAIKKKNKKKRLNN